MRIFRFVIPMFFCAGALFAADGTSQSSEPIWTHIQFEAGNYGVNAKRNPPEPITDPEERAAYSSGVSSEYLLWTSRVNRSRQYHLLLNSLMDEIQKAHGKKLIFYVHDQDGLAASLAQAYLEEYIGYFLKRHKIEIRRLVGDLKELALFTVDSATLNHPSLESGTSKLALASEFSRLAAVSRTGLVLNTHFSEELKAAQGEQAATNSYRYFDLGSGKSYVYPSGVVSQRPSKRYLVIADRRPQVCSAIMADSVF